MTAHFLAVGGNDAAWMPTQGALFIDLIRHDPHLAETSAANAPR
jgi:hypothetical protein